MSNKKKQIDTIENYYPGEKKLSPSEKLLKYEFFRLHDFQYFIAKKYKKLALKLNNKTKTAKQKDGGSASYGRSR